MEAQRQEAETLSLMEARYRVGISQVELGLRTGIDRKQIARYERDEGKMRLDKASRIATALGCRLVGQGFVPDESVSVPTWIYTQEL